MPVVEDGSGREITCKEKALFNAINYYHQAIMQMITLQQNPSLICRSKPSDASRQDDETDFDFRQYRYLLSVFAGNLNASMKLHRDCLGEVEYHPKFRISKQEQEGYESTLPEIFQKYSSRLLKESFYRNTLVKKSYQLYQGQYEKVFPSNAETEPSSRRATPSLGILRKMTLNDGKKNILTLSARSQTRKSASMGSAQEKLLALSQTFKAFQADLMTLKLKTISSDNPETKECFLKATRSTISRNQRQRLKSDHFPLRKKSRPGQRTDTDDLCFKGNEILISEHRKWGDEWQYKQELPFHSKFCTKKVVAIGQSQKKAINDLELLHLQSKNMDASSVFWPPSGDINQRPKFKRWQHSFS